MAASLETLETLERDVSGLDLDEDEEEDLKDEDMPITVLFGEVLSIIKRCQAEDGSRVEPSAVQRGLELLDHITAQVRTLGIFSANEDVDDVNTNDLRFVLAEHYRAKLLTRTPAGDPFGRVRQLKHSRDAHLRFLGQCDTLQLLVGSDLTAYSNITEVGRDEAAEDGSGEGAQRPDPMDPMAKRTMKIERFKRQKADRERLAELSRLLQSEGTVSGDEDVLRDHTLLTIASALRESLDDMESLDNELEVLKFMIKSMPSNPGPGDGSEAGDRRRPNGFRDGEPDPHVALDPGRKGLQVMHMSKDSAGSLRFQRQEIKAQVFQPGHRLPTMSLEELADIEVADAMERQRRQAENPGPVRRIKQLEEAGEEDNPDLVDQATYRDRDWDDWCDENPKGAGNKAGKRF